MLSRIFKRKNINSLGVTAQKTKTILLVDFEYLFYSYRSNFNISPECEKIVDTIVHKHGVDDVYIFADLSRSELAESLGDIQSPLVRVVDTGESFFQRKKNVTDFVILDYAYRFIAKQDTRTVILLTGDGHFRFVMDYIRELGKEVILYAVSGSVSRSLRNPDVLFFELPSEEERYRAYYRMIALQMAFLNDKTHIIPTFMKTAESVAIHNNVPKDRIIDAIKMMIERGYMYQEEQKTQFDKPIRALKVNWSLVRKDGLWSEDREIEIRKKEYANKSNPN